MIWAMTDASWLYSVALALPLALLIDRLFGEPSAALHPVIWMGKLLGMVGRSLPRRPAVSAFVTGTLGWCSGAALSIVISALLQYLLISVSLNTQSVILTALLLAILLKPLLSLRLLIEECCSVESAIRQSLHDGRKQTARICSRNTHSLDETMLRETAVESLAENFTDSVVAPLFWFAIAGLPGAALYRWANTADAMWGYRDIEHEWFGKFAARCDDVLNWIPARLSALALWPAGHLRHLVYEAGKTPSPNGGWPMAATALKLGISLSKQGIYVLNADGQTVGKRDIERTAKLINQSAWYTVTALALMLALSALMIRN